MLKIYFVNVNDRGNKTIVQTSGVCLNHEAKPSGLKAHLECAILITCAIIL